MDRVSLASKCVAGAILFAIGFVVLYFLIGIDRQYSLAAALVIAIGSALNGKWPLLGWPLTALAGLFVYLGW